MTALLEPELRVPTEETSSLSGHLLSLLILDLPPGPQSPSLVLLAPFPGVHGYPSSATLPPLLNTLASSSMPVWSQHFNAVPANEFLGSWLPLVLLPGTTIILILIEPSPPAPEPLTGPGEKSHTGQYFPCKFTAADLRYALCMSPAIPLLVSMFPVSPQTCLLTVTVVRFHRTPPPSPTSKSPSLSGPVPVFAAFLPATVAELCPLRGTPAPHLCSRPRSPSGSFTHRLTLRVTRENCLPPNSCLSLEPTSPLISLLPFKVKFLKMASLPISFLIPAQCLTRSSPPCVPTTLLQLLLVRFGFVKSTTAALFSRPASSGSSQPGSQPSVFKHSSPSQESNSSSSPHR